MVINTSAAVEKLLAIEITERCKYIRVIMSELSRVTDHLTCIAASAMELGAMTAFLYLMKAREYLYEIIEEVTVVVEEIRKEKKEKKLKPVIEKPRPILKVGDRVRMLDGKSVGSIDKIEKNKAVVNYGLFTSKVSLDELEFVEAAKK